MSEVISFYNEVIYPNLFKLNMPAAILVLGLFYLILPTNLVTSHIKFCLSISIVLSFLILYICFSRFPDGFDIFLVGFILFTCCYIGFGWLDSNGSEQLKTEKYKLFFK